MLMPTKLPYRGVLQVAAIRQLRRNSHWLMLLLSVFTLVPQPPRVGGPTRDGRDRLEGARQGNRPSRNLPSPSVRSDYPEWKLDSGFTKDVFTFVRIQYDSLGSRGRGRSWDNDFPDCDWNFSFRLHQLTSYQVDPHGLVMRLTDPRLPDYPFIFMTNVDRMVLSQEEQQGLRRYLLNGGFLMADDFWAPASWRHAKEQMKEVFPDREPIELPRDHEIFHAVYDLPELPQVPSILAWRQGYRFEYWHGDPEGDELPHFWGYFDDQQRLMAIFCHNNDIADGWEREGQDREYFNEYSLKISYPLGINIITYAMSH